MANSNPFDSDDDDDQYEVEKCHDHTGAMSVKNDSVDAFNSNLSKTCDTLAWDDQYHIPSNTLESFRRNVNLLANERDLELDIRSRYRESPAHRLRDGSHLEHTSYREGYERVDERRIRDVDIRYMVGGYRVGLEDANEMSRSDKRIIASSLVPNDDDDDVGILQRGTSGIEADVEDYNDDDVGYFERFAGADTSEVYWDEDGSHGYVKYGSRKPHSSDDCHGYVKHGSGESHDDDNSHGNIEHGSEQLYYGKDDWDNNGSVRQDMSSVHASRSPTVESLKRCERREREVQVPPASPNGTNFSSVAARVRVSSEVRGGERGLGKGMSAGSQQLRDITELIKMIAESSTDDTATSAHSYSVDVASVVETVQQMLDTELERGLEPVCFDSYQHLMSNIDDIQGLIDVLDKSKLLRKGSSHDETNLNAFSQFLADWYERAVNGSMQLKEHVVLWSQESCANLETAISEERKLADRLYNNLSNNSSSDMCADVLSDLLVLEGSLDDYERQLMFERERERSLSQFCSSDVGQVNKAMVGRLGQELYALRHHQCSRLRGRLSDLGVQCPSATAAAVHTSTAGAATVTSTAAAADTGTAAGVGTAAKTGSAAATARTGTVASTGTTIAAGTDTAAATAGTDTADPLAIENTHADFNRVDSTESKEVCRRTIGRFEAGDVGRRLRERRKQLYRERGDRSCDCCTLFKYAFLLLVLTFIAVVLLYLLSTLAGPQSKHLYMQLIHSSAQPM